MRAKLLYLAVFFVLIISCEKNENVTEQTDEPGEYVEIESKFKSVEVSKSSNQFGFDLFKQLKEQNQAGQNIMISPLSISLALSMTYNGAKGDTKSEMQTALRFGDLSDSEINTSNQYITDAILSVDKLVETSIANSIWPNQNISFKQDFISICRDFYDAEVQSLDYTNPGSKDIINKWVEDKTNNRIKNLISSLSPGTAMVLVNAIYFKGKWRYEFDEENTVDEPFYLAQGGEVTKPFMKQNTTVNYTSSEKFKAIELPYGQGNFNMVIMLPHTGNTTGEVIADLSDSNWNFMLSRFQQRKLDIAIPRFKFEYKSSNLKPELMSMGMVKAFEDADFSNMTDDVSLLISQVIHQSFIEVNEEGTEAAAANAVVVDAVSIPVDEPVFIANRPFVFAIYEKSTNTILFLGEYNGL